MKHNLANKPKLYKIPSNLSEHLKFETEIIEWFEAFEKELRELAKIYETSDHVEHWAILQFINSSLLGENSK